MQKNLTNKPLETAFKGVNIKSFDLHLSLLVYFICVNGDDSERIDVHFASCLASINDVNDQNQEAAMELVEKVISTSLRYLELDQQRDGASAAYWPREDI